jgi:hypothetical protein
MKEDKINDEIVELDDSEYEDWQYEFSSDIASDFVDEQLIPALDQFDYDNSDRDYIPGIASYVLFTRMVESLTEQGFDGEELKRLIDEIQDLSQFRIVH